MAAFTCTSRQFSASLDSKGRITVPAEIRNKYNLEEGDSVKLELRNCSTRSKKVSSLEEAQNFIQRFEQVEKFFFDGKTVEVVLRE